MAPIIEMRKMTKAYRGIPAVKDVDFTLEKGEIHALLGENGAGKSTLTKIMAGVVEATSGVMIYRGREVKFASPHRALEAGIRVKLGKALPVLLILRRPLHGFLIQI